MSRICVLGGSGFIGRHLVESLVKQGHRVLVPSRRRERAKHLILLPTVDVVDADVFDPIELRRLFAGMHAVVNLIGIRHGQRGAPYGADYARVHVELPQKVIAACIESKVPRLLHMSALKAATDAPSAYLRSKADGESAVISARGKLHATIFRPSVVFGPEDTFLNTFARLQEKLPVIALGCAQAQFQPVYVGDVAKAFRLSIDADESYGRAYDLVGPRRYSLRELVAYAGRMSGHERRIIELGPRMSYWQAAMLEFAPGKLMTRDDFDSMQVASISDSALPFGLEATPLEAIAPVYLQGVFPRSRYSLFRYYAGRKGREV